MAVSAHPDHGGQRVGGVPGGRAAVAVDQDEVDPADFRQSGPLRYPYQTRRDQPPGVGHHAEARPGRRA